MNKRVLNNQTLEGKKELMVEDEQKLEELKRSLANLSAYAYVKPNPMWSGIYENREESEKIIDLTLSTLHEILCDEKKRDKIIDRVLSEIIVGAYQDRIVAYTISPSGMNKDSTEAMEIIQRIRQKADMHLIRVIQAFKDIKRPPVSVVVKQADQVNVGDKQMNIDKQLNISTDLDKK
jgi:hypothetical protein